MSALPRDTGDGQGTDDERRQGWRELTTEWMRRSAIYWVSLLCFVLVDLGLLLVWYSTYLESEKAKDWVWLTVRQVGFALLVAGVTAAILDPLLRKISSKREEKLQEWIKEDVLSRLAEVRREVDGATQIFHEELDSLRDDLRTTGGLERGLHIMGATNSFSDFKEARQRLVWALTQASEQILLLGVTLRAFFHQEEPSGLHGALTAAVRRVKDARVLLLDRDSEQAHIASFREYPAYHLDARSMTIARYLSKHELHQRSALVEGLLRSEQWIRRIEGWGGKAERVRVYRSAPSLFMLITDDSVFVEQRHYNWPSRGPTEMPTSADGEQQPDQGWWSTSQSGSVLLEFSRSQPAMRGRAGQLSIYEALKDHFEFVYNYCARPLEPPADYPL